MEEVTVCLHPPHSIFPAICRQAAAQGYEDFYFPLVEENQLHCVTKCTSGVDGAISCNQGQRFLEKSSPLAGEARPRAGVPPTAPWVYHLAPPNQAPSSSKPPTCWRPQGKGAE